MIPIGLINEKKDVKHNNPKDYKYVKAAVRMKLDQDTVDEIKREKLN